MIFLLSIHKTIDGKMTKLDTIQDGCWVNLTYPSEDELNTVAATLGVEPTFLRAALDEDYKLEQQVQLLIGLLYWKYAEGKKGIRYQECLSRIEGVLCEELSFVLDLSKDLLVERLEDCYRSMA